MATKDTPLTDEQIIANNVARQRKALGWSMNQLAAEMLAAGHENWHSTGVSRVEAGAQRLYLAEMLTLTDLLGDITAGTRWERRVGSPPLDPCVGTRGHVNAIARDLRASLKLLDRGEAALERVQATLKAHRVLVESMLEHVEGLDDAHDPAARRRSKG